MKVQAALPKPAEFASYEYHATNQSSWERTVETQQSSAAPAALPDAGGGLQQDLELPTQAEAVQSEDLHLEAPGDPPFICKLAICPFCSAASQVHPSTVYRAQCMA